MLAAVSVICLVRVTYNRTKELRFDERPQIDKHNKVNESKYFPSRYGNCEAVLVLIISGGEYPSLV